MPAPARQIVFLSGFGLGNKWVGICHAVMSRISSQSPIVDLSHLIRPLEVGSALLLADSLPYIAEDAFVLAVVDPNVGKDREVAVETVAGASWSVPTTACWRQRGRRPVASGNRWRSRRTM
jgi:S-adenosyl-L-methionine hydrolase (adenosine-forming)